MVHDSNSISKNICFLHKVCCNKNGSLAPHILRKEFTDMNNSTQNQMLLNITNYLKSWLICHLYGFQNRTCNALIVIKQH
jgi:hypothetical protein